MQLNFKFSKIKDYANFLNEKITSLDAINEYNFFLHLVSFSSNDVECLDFMSQNQTIEKKIESIFNKGILLNNNHYSTVPYSSMNGTTTFIGSSKNVSPFDILKYKYDQQEDELRVVIIVAVPKWSKLNGQTIEFSSYNGTHSPISIKNEKEKKSVREIENAYAKMNVAQDIRHTKFSLLDCTLSGCIPKEFILGMHIIDQKNEKIIYRSNPDHLSELTNVQKIEFNQNLENKLSYLAKTYNSDNLLDLITRNGAESMKYYNNLLSEEI